MPLLKRIFIITKILKKALLRDIFRNLKIFDVLFKKCRKLEKCLASDEKYFENLVPVFMKEEMFLWLSNSEFRLIPLVLCIASCKENAYTLTSSKKLVNYRLSYIWQRWSPWKEMWECLVIFPLQYFNTFLKFINTFLSNKKWLPAVLLWKTCISVKKYKNDFLCGLQPRNIFRSNPLQYFQAVR